MDTHLRNLVKAAGVLLGVACSLPPTAPDIASPEIRRLGHMCDAGITATTYVLANETVCSQVEALGVELEQLCDLPVKPCVYRVIIDPTINALSVPPNYVYVTTGMLDFLESRDELMAILAHEFVHLEENHGEKSLYEEQAAAWWKDLVVSSIATGVGAAAGIAGAGPAPAAAQSASQAGASQVSSIIANTLGSAVTSKALAPLANSIAMSLTRSYSHDQEYEADAGSFRLLSQTPYDERALEHIFERLDGLPIQERELNGATHFLGNELSLQKRLKALKRLRR